MFATEFEKTNVLQLDGITHYKVVPGEGIFQEDTVLYPRYNTPEENMSIASALTEKVGPLTSFLDHYAEIGIDTGTLQGNPIIGNPQAIVTHTEFGRIASLRFRAFDRLMHMGGIYLEADWLSTDLTIADWSTYLANLSGTNPKIDPATVPVPVEYNDQFTHICSELFGQGLPSMGVYTVTPYDNARERFFRRFIERINEVRVGQAILRGDTGCLPIHLNEPLVSGRGVHKNIPL